MGKIKVNIKLPENYESLSLEEKKIFPSYKSILVKVPSIKILKNAFVTEDGIVLKNGVLVNGCAFNLKGSFDNTFYKHFWRKAIEQLLVCRFGKSLPSVQLKKPNKYILIHSAWFNYSFWINGFLPRLIMLEEAGYTKDCKLIVPESWQSLPYVWESIKAFDIQLEMIPSGHHLFVDYLIMPETREWTASFYPPLIQKTSKILIEKALKKSNNQQFPQKIYLTRSQRGVRSIENEQEIQNFLISKGYSVIKTENYSIWEQINMFSTATHFVSIHGAGFSNVMFMPKNAFVLEFVNKQYAEKEYTFPFWNLCNALNLNYHICFGNVANSNEKFTLEYGKNKGSENTFLVNQNIIIDLEKIKKIEQL